VIILDTNVVSEMMRAVPEPTVVAWLDRQPRPSVWLTAVTLFEIHFGLGLLAAGRRRRQLEDAFARALDDDFEGRVLPFETEAARAAAAIAVSGRQTGRSMAIRDVQIAGIAVSRRATLATHDTRHFIGLGIALVDPWAS
jgi:predicted nucleic acid-binding protein